MVALLVAGMCALAADLPNLDPAWVRRETPEHYTKLLQHEQGHYSILRTSALPDEDMPRFYEELRRVIADSNVELVTAPSDGRAVRPPSRRDTEMFRALENAAALMFGGASVLPSMLTGATDMAQLREKGVQAYGIGPAGDEKADAIAMAHADDGFQFRAVLEVARAGR